MILNVLTLEQLEHAAEILKALAHPLRISIINILDEGKKLTVSEIQEAIGVEQSVASHHLTLLKNKGILQSKRIGKNIYYTLKHENLSNIVNCVSKCSL